MNFVIEYAAYKLNCICNNELMKDEHKSKKSFNVARAVYLYQHEDITTDEAIKMILEA